MAGKFLKRPAIIDTVKGEHRMNAVRKRDGLTGHPIHAFACGCPDINCGAFHVIRTDRTIPSASECSRLLAKNNQIRKPPKPGRKRTKLGHAKSINLGPAGQERA